MSRAMTTLAPSSAKSATTPARGHVAMAKPQQAGLILTATAGVICSVLFLWLLVAPWIRAPASLEPVWAMALPLPEGAGASVEFADRDARRISGSAAPVGTASEPPAARLERELAAFLDRHAGRSAVFYIASACDASGEPALVTTGDGPGDASGRLTLEALIRLVKTHGKGASKLLLLDAGQLGPDREVGFSDPDLRARLKTLIGEDASIAALLACEPGQISWVAEGRGTSIFAHYLDQAMGESTRATAGSLRDYVRPRVRRWVAENRGGAVQTPDLIGNAGLRLALPRRSPGARSADPAAEADATPRKDLIAEWIECRRLAEHRPAPARVAPIAWRGYQGDLLRAERLHRAGSPEFAAALDLARRDRRALEQTMAEPPTARPWSLAMARHYPADRLRVDPSAYESAVDRLLQKLARPPATGAEMPPAPPREEPKSADAKAPAKGQEPKAREEPRAKDEPKPRADDPAAEPDPIDVLTDGGGAQGNPLYVEGQVPVWYARFVALGGETDAMRPARVALVRRAYGIRKLVESANRDDRVTRWVRPLIDRADAPRRRAQDLLFSGDEAGLAAAGAEMDRAEALASQALVAADACSQALDLLDSLRDELPFDGEFLARTVGPMDASYLGLLDGAARVAALVDAPAGDMDSTEKARLALVAAARKLDRAAREFRERIGRGIASLAASGDWRQIDAALTRPTLDPTLRATLLERVGSAPLSPPLEDASAPDDGPAAPDPAFWQRAIGLAAVEGGLLALAGADDVDLAPLVATARSNWDKNPDAARSALDSATARARTARESLASSLRDPGDEASPSRKAPDLARVSPALPWAELRRVTLAGGRDATTLGRVERVAWLGDRLSQDFAGREAWQLLTDARPDVAQAGKDDPIAREIDLAGVRSAARLKLVGPGPGSEPIRVDRSGPLPEGLAVAFVPPDPGDPGIRVSVRVADRTAPPAPDLLAVPSPDPAPLSFKDAQGRAAGLRNPVVFYRGRAFTPEGIKVDRKDLVTVKVRQKLVRTHVVRKDGRGKVLKSLPVTVPDQFARHEDRGYLHPGDYLIYKLELVNTSDRKLRLTVCHGLKGRKAKSQAIEIDSGRTDGSLTGTVEAVDLDDAKPTDLEVRVTEDGEGGPPAARPLILPFYRVKPSTDFIKQTIGFNNGVLSIAITHTPADPVTGPIHVGIRVEPLNAIKQIDIEPFDIPVGWTFEYRYQITDPTIPKVQWSIFADGEKLIEDELEVNSAALPPAPAAPPPAAPKDMPPAGP